MILIAAGALLVGVDKILGNRFGLGQKFDDGFLLMGSMALSMTGIICLAPMLSSWLGTVIRPAFSAVGIDPSMFGCTLVFTIPVGMSVLSEVDRPWFLKGLLAGLISLPVGLLAGGLLQGLPLGTILWQCVPIFLLSAVLLLGLIRFPGRTVRLFSGFARLIQIVATIGLILAAVQDIAGITILSGLAPLTDSLEIVGSIAIVMGKSPVGGAAPQRSGKAVSLDWKKNRSE